MTLVSLKQLLEQEGNVTTRELYEMTDCPLSMLQHQLQTFVHEGSLIQAAPNVWELP